MKKTMLISKYLKNNTHTDNKNSPTGKLNHDFFPDRKSDAAMLQRLKTQSQKKERFTAGRNRQEDIRLQVINNVLEKDYVYEDSNWLKDFIELKKSLNQIQHNSNLYADNTFNNIDNFETVKRKKRRPLKIKSQNGHKNKLNQENDIDIKWNISPYREFESSSLIKPNSPKPTIITKFDEISEIKLGNDPFLGKSTTNFLKSVLNDNSDDSTESDTITVCKSDYKSIKSNTRSIHSHHNDSNQKTSLLPCTILKSYTSMVGFMNDKTKEELEMVNLANSIPIKSRLLSTRPGTTYTQFTRKSTKRDDEEDEQEEQCFSKTLVDNLIANKSIRRPLKQANSAKDLIFKLRALQSKVQYCKDQNDVNLKSDDRNIRYGAPIPRKNINRQLKIISQLETK